MQTTLQDENLEQAGPGVAVMLCDRPNTYYALDETLAAKYIVMDLNERSENGAGADFVHTCNVDNAMTVTRKWESVLPEKKAVFFGDLVLHFPAEVQPFSLEEKLLLEDEVVPHKGRPQ